MQIFMRTIFAAVRQSLMLRWLCLVLAASCLNCACAAVVMEEGFNYPAGGALGTNAPWAGGSGNSVGVVSGNLSFTNSRGTAPAGNMLQITGGTSQTVYRNFSGNAITGGTVYCSALIRCITPPTNTQFLASLLSSGRTTHSSGFDPIALSVSPSANGYSFSLTSVGGDSSPGGGTMTTNTTHLIVLKYVFTGKGVATMYVDPTPGNPEPSSPAITADTGDNVAANLQVLLFQSSSSVGQGVFNLDTIRVGTNWADVTPLPYPLAILTQPQSLAVCSGSSATFSVTVTGTPPVRIQWRTNGVAVAAATNADFTLPNPVVAATLNQYDAVVSDAFGSVTSGVAKLSISAVAPTIVFPPTNQVVLPNAASATFNVTAAGDAPMGFQWRVNGVPIQDATNSSYVINNPGPADAPNSFDVVVSNPCGSVTSAPPARLFLVNEFSFLNDGGQFIFGGEILTLIAGSGMNLAVWSSPDPTIAVTNWGLEGQMQESPYGNGTSRYSLVVTPPASSLVYYVCAAQNTGPYPATEPLTWLTTDSGQNSTVTSATNAISPTGVFQFASAAPQGVRLSIIKPATDTVGLSGSTAPNLTYVIQASASLASPNWVSIFTNTTAADGSFSFQTNAASAGSQYFRIMFP